MTAAVAGLVSAIIPVYNRPQELTMAVTSVLEQDYRPLEVIIVDDGSTDDTPGVAAELARAHPGTVNVVSRPNGGPGLAREAGRQRARGEFIQYLDSDDVLLPGKLERQVAALLSASDCQVAYGMTRYRAADGSIIAGPDEASAKQEPAMFPSFLVSRWWETATPLYRRSIVDQAGPWTDLRLEEDWEYDCRVASFGTRLTFVAALVCEHRDHPGNRLSRVSPADVTAYRHRARAHTLIFQHALRGGVPRDSPEMRRFARELFLLARQCGACGLVEESRHLFHLARKASTPERSRGTDFRLYRLASALFGWVRAARAAQVLERIRSRAA